MNIFKWTKSLMIVLAAHGCVSLCQLNTIQKKLRNVRVSDFFFFFLSFALFWLYSCFNPGSCATKCATFLSKIATTLMRFSMSQNGSTKTIYFICVFRQKCLKIENIKTTSTNRSGMAYKMQNFR